MLPIVPARNLENQPYTEQPFEVEPSDVGIYKNNFNGFGKGGYLFTKEDIGRCVLVLTSTINPEWSYWKFPLEWD